jgi:hypothetical protein
MIDGRCGKVHASYVQQALLQINMAENRNSRTKSGWILASQILAISMKQFTGSYTEIFVYGLL